jgi:AAA+ superfamily predicted ATPase
MNLIPVGASVKFISTDFHCPPYLTESDGIPPHLLMHGRATFKENKGLITAYVQLSPSPSEPVYIVEFTDDTGNQVALGFEPRFILNYDNEKKENSETPKSPGLDFTPLSRLIIAPEAKEEIISVLKQHQHSKQIFEDWGLGEVIEYGRGMTFLFYGPPGTGKTWAAHCIAKTLNKELLVIGSAEIQSSEPGAANRNIKRAFADAKSRNKILFLDECDSLIASRADVGMVLSSEINTLLTETEKFEGVLVLATNRVEELDEALERRIALIVEFPEPNYEQRTGIWKVMLPKKMPLEKDVTLEVLSQYKLTGGQIKNVVLQAARLALASDAKKVGLKHFESAIARVHKSKSLMGTASRYRNFAMKESFGMGTRVGNQVKKRHSDHVDVDVIKEKSDGPRELETK